MINRIVKGIDGIRIGVHICCGNWSKQEEVLLKGDYAPLLPALEPMKISQFVLEYATPRAGDIEVVGKKLSDRELGLGDDLGRNNSFSIPTVVSAVSRAARSMSRKWPTRNSAPLSRRQSS